MKPYHTVTRTIRMQIGDRELIPMTIDFELTDEEYSKIKGYIVAVRRLIHSQN